MALTSDNLFVNLPVKDLNRAIDFFSAIGFEFNSQFTDHNAACMVINDRTFVMLLVEEFFQTFMSKEIANTAKSSEVIMALSASSRENVDSIVDKALALGGSVSQEPVDHGFMYTRSFQDPDGHLWEVIYMDAKAIQ
ncbi:VOC family protein [Paenibacillus sp. 32352]|uniref:VOC family protein n=1 Tax=Paenibacillus sp. 32352 TaxID=1969111 RepID=UPI0009AE5E0D|nr:VOC family protein [Paenibacillus sp. 32352]